MALVRQENPHSDDGIGITIINALQASTLDSRLEQAINALGIESARDQQLGAAITSIAKLRGTNHRVYLLSKQQSDGARQIVGLLKTGAKKLFLTDVSHQWHEKQCDCVLDFYVAHQHQRQGYGKQLLDTACRLEKRQAYDYAYDRPSHKMRAFLRKHFNLTQPLDQANKFLVFPTFFA